MSNIYVHTRVHSKKGEVKNRETQKWGWFGGYIITAFLKMKKQKLKKKKTAKNVV